MPIKFDSLSAAKHGRDTAEQLAFGERRIVLVQRIATRNQLDWPVGCHLTIDQSVRVETALPGEEHNVSVAGVLRRRPADRELSISWE